jgi:diaminohydroxyphosphoribosylaminopyrimidine deaminase/5-amino-6-(5-phosphoribosylamino)uracil reductase
LVILIPMHEIYLKHALQLAQIRKGFCAPNPSVGAIVVNDNQIIAEGYHWGSGHPHAEVEALNKINGELSDATLYVTLEPCCHTKKKTPPCTELIIARGIKKVIYGFRDPNPQVSGLGEKRLREMGIDCTYVELPAITEFYRDYQYWWQTGKPFVTAKLAMSLDGKIAGPNGQRVNITGKEAQLFTHQQRKLSDGILTTAKTIFCDDPLLNARLPEGEFAKPVYVLDKESITPANAKIFQSAERVTIVNKTDLNQILQDIGQDGIHNLWIEAGGKCFSAFLQADLIQRAFIYIAPKWLGAEAQAAFDLNIDIFASAKKQQWQALGQDAVCELIFI